MVGKTALVTAALPTLHDFDHFSVQFDARTKESQNQDTE